MGFFDLAIGGLGFVLIGVSEALSSKPPISDQTWRTSSKASPSLSLAALFSSLVVLNSAFSLLDALGSRDRVGSVLQLQTLAIASLFFLHAVAGVLSGRSGPFSSLPSLLLDSIALFAFAEEFLLFYLQRKDASGIENRYFDLVLVPIAVCVVSTILALISPESSSPKFARGIGMVLQGTWLVQMAVSFHTGMVAQGCSVHSKSRGNYTVKCKGHGEYHRARAIATLQFNCHLAVLVVVASALYSVIARRSGDGFAATRVYRPIAGEMQAYESRSQFTLDSDGDEDGEIKEEENVGKEKGGSIELGLNGHHVSSNKNST